MQLRESGARFGYGLPKCGNDLSQKVPDLREFDLIAARNKQAKDKKTKKILLWIGGITGGIGLCIVALFVGVIGVRTFANGKASQRSTLTAESQQIKDRIADATRAASQATAEYQLGNLSIVSTTVVDYCDYYNQNTVEVVLKNTGTETIHISSCCNTNTVGIYTMGCWIGDTPIPDENAFDLLPGDQKAINIQTGFPPGNYTFDIEIYIDNLIGGSSQVAKTINMDWPGY
jgi:hypothetical protein